MNTDKASTGYYSNRLRELQEKFRDLEPGIKDSETKQAISVLYGMVQEIIRKVETSGQGQEPGVMTLKDVASMYRNAPKMSGAAICTPLSAGSKAPDFELSNADGKMVRLADFRGSTLLLVFYPLDWSPGCSQQLDLYQHEFSEFERRGVSLAGISIDSIYSHGAWSAVRGLRFPLLADFNPKGEVAKSYKVFREQDGFSERALFFIDGDGVIRHSYVSPYLHHIPDIYYIFKQLDEIRKSVPA